MTEASKYFELKDYDGNTHKVVLSNTSIRDCDGCVFKRPRGGCKLTSLCFNKNNEIFVLYEDKVTVEDIDE